MWRGHIPVAAAAILCLASAAIGQEYAGPPGLVGYDPPHPAACEESAGPPPERFWLRGEYVGWATVTREGLERNEETTASRLFDAVLALTGTGRDDIAEAAFRGRYGYRLTAGLWADPAATWGVEGSVMFLDRRPVAAPPVTSGDLAGLGAIAAGIILPGLSGEGGGTVVVPITAGNLAAGTLALALGDQQFLDVQALGRARLIQSDTTRADGLLGYRGLVFEEALGVSARMTALAPPLLVGSTVVAGVAVQSRSTSYGVLLGADCATTCGCVEFGVRPSVTIAYVENSITRQAFATASVPGLGQTTLGAGGVFFPGPLGRTSSSDWAVLPELSVRLAVLFGSNARLVLGAGVLVIPSVGRATGQLDLGLPVQGLVPGVSGVPLAGVAVSPTEDTLYLGTASVGLEIRF